MNPDEHRQAPNEDSAGPLVTRRRAAAWTGVLLWGAIAAFTVAVTPFEFLVLPLAGAYVSIRAIGPIRRRWIWALLVFVGALTGLGWLPTKPLDEKVAPIRVEAESVRDVWKRLQAERKLYGHWGGDVADEPRLIVFETKQSMSKREMSEKFAQENGLKFDEKYCLSGSTILFGAYPQCSIRPLREVDAKDE